METPINNDTVTTNLVEPMTLKGFRDYFPNEMIARNHVIESIRGVYEKFGFLPIDTPILEYLVTLIGTGGEETNKELFRFESPEKDPIAMRFDLTVPFARLIAQYPEQILLPFRRYHIGPVFRADKPDVGRYRQFTQFDIDVAGSKSVAVDAEIVAAMCEALGRLGLKNDRSSPPEYLVRINNRKLMNALMEDCGLADINLQKHVLRVIDKLQKIGVDNVRRELGRGRIDDSGSPIKGVGLAEAVIERILHYIAATGGTRGAVIETLAKLLSTSAASQLALDEMRELAQALDGLEISESQAIFDPSLTRGLEYYTGPVFEACLPVAPQFGSVMGGGRYDSLVERFMAFSIPATGASIGVDRLIAALLSSGKLKTTATTTQVIVIGMEGVPKPELLRIAKQLRDNQIPTELYLGAPRAQLEKAKLEDHKDPKVSVRNQMSHANDTGIPIAVIIGTDELNAGTVSVKNLVVGKEQRDGVKDHEAYVKLGKVGQTTVKRADLVATIREMLK